MNRYDRIVSTVLACAAVAFLAMIVKREVQFKQTPTQALNAERLDSSEWADILRSAYIEGDTAHAVVLATFFDIECPFCRRSHQEIEKLYSEQRDSLTLAFVHFPLPQHSLATTGARALECTEDSRAYLSLLKVLYDRQGKLDPMNWRGYAWEAGVKDTVAFEDCMRSSRSLPKVDQGKAVGSRIGVTGTPFVVVNGWKFSLPPSDSILRASITNIRQGKHPLTGETLSSSSLR